MLTEKLKRSLYESDEINLEPVQEQQLFLDW